ncbi:uncharacterized protein [Nicotiana sylvestris]|uniref:uncharacterized protein n=1 Tax=Nicotiana sylvestris TaxID=4096 RepID=UPI00388C566D
MEGTEHNQALYLTVKFEDSVVSRVLVDNGSRMNICPLSTLQKLKNGTERIHLNNVCVRGFDGGGKDSVGDIMLELAIRPVEFTMEFQVLDVAVFYNLLLGRPWIHTTKAVPSSLHQMVKFEWDRQEIVVHGDEDLSACNDTIVSFIEVEDDKGPWVYQTFETVSVEKIPEGKCIPGPKLSSASVMVVNKMLKNGFVPGKEKPKPNLSETEAIDLGDQDDVRETKISVHLEQQVKEEIIKILFEYKDVFAWSYDDIPGLRNDLVAHKLPTDPTFHLVKQKLRKFMTDMSVKIKEEITKQLTAKILMDEEDAEKTAFITPWGTCCYRVMPFGLKNAGATYMREMTTIFHDMIHKEIEVYVDDVIIKSKKHSDHVKDLRKFFQRLRRYNLKLNPAKYAFGVPSGKLLGFVVSRCGIELDPSKIKAIQELPPPKNKTELLKKNVVVKWTDECQEAFDKIKRYLSNPPVLVPPEPGRPLILYLIVLDNSFGYVLGQHDITEKKDQTIYYLSKKFTPYEDKYTLLERTCCALTWVTQRLKHYLSSYTTYLISRIDPLKYMFQKPMPTGRLAKWQILLTEFDIIYVNRTAMKA